MVNGLLAQLVERLVCTEEVRSSTLLESIFLISQSKGKKLP
jgi:hypothetical protein